MKVLYIIHSSGTGGATISLRNMIEGILHRGIEPILVYPKKQYNDVIKRFEEMGVLCYGSYIAISAIAKQNKIKEMLSFLKIIALKVLSLINLLIITHKTKPDIIHTNTGVVHEGFWVSKLLKIPHVWHIREYQTLDFNLNILPSKKSLQSKLSKSYTIFITNELQHYFNQDSCPSSVIYNPIYDINDVPKNISTKQKYFLVANRISKEKGIEDIITGFANFSKINDGYLLKIAGFGKEKYINELKSLCFNLSINKKVEFLGYVSDMRPLICNAEILFVGSYFEAFGRMTAEANLIGTFVIGRNTGGTKEIIELTHGGVLFDSVNEIPSLINNYITKQMNEKNKLLKDAQHISFQFFSKAEHCDKISQLYTKILSNHYYRI